MDIASHLLPKRFKGRSAEYARGHHFLPVGPGITPADVETPDFWQHLTARLAVDDLVEVVAEDGSFDMEVRVVALDPSEHRLWAQVRVLCCWQGKPAEALPENAGYRPEWGGPVHRWRIMQGNTLVEHGHPDKPSATAAALKLQDAAAARKAA